MCSLFITVYLIETSLWVRSLVPAPPAASPALCPDTEGEMASSVPFWKLSSCQSGSDIFTMLPWAHLLCPHPRPRHCKPPLPLLATRSPSSRQGTRAKSTCDGQTSCRLHIPNFSFSSRLPLPLCSSVCTTTNWPKQKICSHVVPRKEYNAITSSKCNHTNVVSQ